MFRIVCDPSSKSIKLYLTEIFSGSLMFVVCLIGVWQRNFEPVLCVCVRYDGLQPVPTDGRMDRHDKANSRFSQFCESP